MSKPSLGSLYETLGLSKRKTCSLGHSRRMFIHGDRNNSKVPFTIAFNLAAGAVKCGETPLVVCRKSKCSFGNLPPMVTELMNQDHLEQYHKNKGNEPCEWDLNTLGKIKVHHVETFEDLLNFMCSIHKWKNETPTMIVIDDLASYLSESNQTYLEMLRAVTLVENALLCLNNELRDEISQAMQISRSFNDDSGGKSSSGTGVGMGANELEVVTVPAVLTDQLLRSQLGISEVALLVSETSQLQQVREHITEKLRLEVELEVVSIENDAQVLSDDKVKISISRTPYTSKYRRPLKGDVAGASGASGARDVGDGGKGACEGSVIGIHPPLLLERGRDNGCMYSYCVGIYTDE